MERHTIAFLKYHGTGNDFIMIDDREEHFDTEDQQLIEHMCHRRFGIGADGLILLRDHADHDFEMIYFNSDGRQSSMCGNGGRCIVAFANDLNMVGNTCTFLAIDGVHEGKVLENGLISLKMNNVKEVEESGGAYILNTGSPHYVRKSEDLQNKDFVQRAQEIRYSERFARDGINVNFINISGNNMLEMRTYERGVEGETYSCGTGVVAAAIVADKMTTITGELTVVTKGGELKVNLEKSSDGVYKNIWLTGPASYIFSGKYYN